MSGSQDKQRIAEMGKGPLTLCVVLLLLCMFGIFLTKMAWQISDDFVAQYGHVMDDAIQIKLAQTAAVPVLYLMSAAALFYGSGRFPVILTIGTMLYATYGSLWRLVELMQGRDLALFDFWSILDLALLVGIVGYLLFSLQIERLYGLGSRRLLTTGIPNLWQRGRGRPTTQQAEASRLDETFN